MLTAEQLARSVHETIRNLPDWSPLDWEWIPVQKWEELNPVQAAWCQRIATAVCRLVAEDMAAERRELRAGRED